MKILNENPVKQKTEIHAEIAKEFKLIGSMKYVNGHKLFEFNYRTLELNEAKIDIQIFVGENGRPVKRMKAYQNKDCYYFQKLNRKNAVKHINKILKKHNEEIG